MIESQAPETRPAVRLKSECLWVVEVFHNRPDLGSGTRDSNREVADTWAARTGGYNFSDKGGTKKRSTGYV
jgi:hypothetical protein